MCKDSVYLVAYLFPFCTVSDVNVAVKETAITLFAGF
jgi:hypothetical protein